MLYTQYYYIICDATNFKFLIAIFYYRIINGQQLHINKVEEIPDLEDLVVDGGPEVGRL